MAADGKINGHRPVGLLPMLGGAEVGLNEVPAHAETALRAVTGIRTHVPDDAHTAPYLGTEREGNAIVIDDSGLIVTIGYLLLECAEVELVDSAGRWVDASFVGYDFETGFGLARAATPLGILPARLAAADSVPVGTPVIVAGRGGRAQSMHAQVVSRRSFAGYWEYRLEEAIFTAPAHPNWGGTGLVAPDGSIVAVGSLLVEDAAAPDRATQGNMFVPVDLLLPILDELSSRGRVGRPSRPWLGMFTAEAEGFLVVTHVTEGGPAERAGLAAGDVVVRVADEAVDRLGRLYERIWSLGPAGVAVPLSVIRSGVRLDISVASGDRYTFFRTPRA